MIKKWCNNICNRLLVDLTQEENLRPGSHDGMKFCCLSNGVYALKILFQFVQRGERCTFHVAAYQQKLVALKLGAKLDDQIGIPLYPELAFTPYRTPSNILIHGEHNHHTYLGKDPLACLDTTTNYLNITAPSEFTTLALIDNNTLLTKYLSIHR